MTQNKVHSALDALIYLADCNAATCEYMASLKSAARCEMRRHISMTRMGLDWYLSFGGDLKEYTSVNKRLIEAIDLWNTSRPTQLVKDEIL